MGDERSPSRRGRHLADSSMLRYSSLSPSHSAAVSASQSMNPSVCRFTSASSSWEMPKYSASRHTKEAWTTVVSARS